MNKALLSASAFITASILLLSSCGGDTTETPSNLIQDLDGIKVDLDWTTGGSVNDALKDCDMDLYIYFDNKKFKIGESSVDFERLAVATSDEDGEYTISTKLYSTTKNVNYTVTVNGISESKPYTFNSTFPSTETNREIEVLTVRKSGRNFTVSPVD